MSATDFTPPTTRPLIRELWHTRDGWCWKVSRTLLDPINSGSGYASRSDAAEAADTACEAHGDPWGTYRKSLRAAGLAA